LFIRACVPELFYGRPGTPGCGAVRALRQTPKRLPVLCSAPERGGERSPRPTGVERVLLQTELCSWACASASCPTPKVQTWIAGGWSFSMSCGRAQGKKSGWCAVVAEAAGGVGALAGAFTAHVLAISGAKPNTPRRPAHVWPLIHRGGPAGAGLTKAINGPHADGTVRHPSNSNGPRPADVWQRVLGHQSLRPRPSVHLNQRGSCRATAGTNLEWLARRPGSRCRRGCMKTDPG